MRRRRRDGFALVTALWALVVVGALGVQFYALARADRQVAANVRAATRARWAARAGLARTTDALDRALASNALVAVGDTVLPPVVSNEHGVAVRGAVLDLRARVQINRADADDLRTLFSALGLEMGDAERLADAVLDWRDPDAYPRARGAEGAEYLRRVPASRPKDAPFDRVEELRSVLGVTERIYARLAPHLAVAGDGRVNVNSASVPVLLTLPGLDVEGALVIAERRRLAPYRNVFELLASLPRPTQAQMQARLGSVVDRVAFTPREVEIVVTAVPDGAGPGAALTATMMLSGASTRALQRVVER